MDRDKIIILYYYRVMFYMRDYVDKQGRKRPLISSRRGKSNTFSEREQPNTKPLLLEPT